VMDLGSLAWMTWSPALGRSLYIAYRHWTLGCPAVVYVFSIFIKLFHLDCFVALIEPTLDRGGDAPMSLVPPNNLSP
jgi:hypothetical protein